MEKLQKVQNVACRTILGADKYTNIKQMHKELEILTLDQCRKLHQSMECFTNINNPEAGLNYIFQRADDDRIRSTRSTGTKCMKVPNIRSTIGRKAYSYRGPCFWNNLDIESRSIEKKEPFKRHISKALCRDVNHPG